MLKPIKNINKTYRNNLNQIQGKMEKRMLVIYGYQNAGKSTTVKILYKKLLGIASSELNKRNNKIVQDVDKNNCLINNHGDVFSILDVNDIKVALIGHGDYVSVLEEKLNDEDVKASDYVVCCCRYKYNKNSTNKLLQDKYKDQIIDWYYLERADSVEGKKENETKVAEDIYNKLLELVKNKKKEFCEKALSSAFELFTKMLGDTKEPSKEELKNIEEIIGGIINKHPDDERYIRMKVTQFFKKKNILFE